MSDQEVDIQTNEPSAAETEARQFGWVPKEEFKGEESKWRSAEEFLEKGRVINGFLRNDLEKIKLEAAKYKNELSQVKETMAEFAKFHQETEERAYKRALEDLKKEKADAIEKGEGGKVVEIDEQIALVREAQKEKTTPVKQDQPTVPPTVFYDWNKDNLWYGSNAELTRLAEVFSEEVKAFNPNLIGREFLDEVTRRVKERAPEHFSNTRREVPRVGGGNEGSGTLHTNNKDKKTFDNLPKEAQVLCDKFIKQGLIKSREQYVKEYEWD